MNMETNPPRIISPEPPPPPTRGSPPTKWLGFWIALLATTVVTLLLALAGKGEDAVIGYIVIYGSGVSAIICGYLVAGRFASSPAARVVAAIPLAVGFYFLSVCLCFAGCVLGNTLK